MRVGGVIANRSKATDEIDRFNEVVGLERVAHLPDLDEIRKSRLKKRTLFEMDETDAVLAVQKNICAWRPACWLMTPSAILHR